MPFRRNKAELSRLWFFVTAASVAAALAACGERGTAAPPGSEKKAATQALEAGAKALQSSRPLAPMDIHLLGLHPLKDDPSRQMLVHHFCRQVNEDFAQCVLFDGDGPQANLNGIEYIVSEKIFETMPAAERPYWHPHNYEILSGQLAAPGLPAAAEEALMRGKMNSYGKTWHVWHTGHAGAPGDQLPFGPAVLGWSLNRDGEAQPELLAEHGRLLGEQVGARRERRLGLVGMAKPQAGVDALKGRFGRPTQDIPGVQDKAGAGAGG